MSDNALCGGRPAVSLQPERIASATLHIGDCLDVLPQLAAEGFRAHAVVTDPPYELNFMGREWDRTGVAFRPETWRAVFDCMLPGAFLVAFASTRGYHRMVCAIEDADFVIHPMLGWVFATGFPKATRFQQPELEGWRYGLQALKPALEPICVAQRPLDGTGSQNWAKHGCGGLNVDASRIGTTENTGRPGTISKGGILNVQPGGCVRQSETHAAGRWPANLLHDGSPEVEQAFAAFGERRVETPRSGGFRPDGAVRGQVDFKSGARPTSPNDRGDGGSPSRFFYTCKADARDRAGSKHPCVKPSSLMRWLVRLVCSEGGTILDPFAGSGSTGLAADQCGMRSVLVERDAQYVEDIKRKLSADAPLFAEVEQRMPDLDAAYQRHGDLFAEAAD